MKIERKIYFTADTHFGHTNIIRYCKRPFSSVEEMNETLIERWNSKVTPHDIVYHLGDFTLEKIADKYLDKLNGTIRLIPGGHDYWLKHIDTKKYAKRLEILPLYYTLKILGLKIILCHYPMLSWDSSSYGSLHFHGHSHGNIPSLYPRLDVGTDCFDYYPVSLEDIFDNDSWVRPDCLILNESDKL